MLMLDRSFFERDAMTVAQDLLGKVILHKSEDVWLCVKIIETEAYFKSEKASHASLGYTEKRKALFMSPGTIYMYFARGGDSLNFSCLGDGNAVLIKAGVPHSNVPYAKQMISIMQKFNPIKNTKRERLPMKLCSGQTLLCRSLNLKVREWDQKQFDEKSFYVADVGYNPQKIIQTKRLGIPPGRDEHLPYRFIDYDYAAFCTSNILKKRNSKPQEDYNIINKTI